MNRLVVREKVAVSYWWTFLSVFLMVVALVIVFFLSRRLVSPAAVVGGMGFLFALSIFSFVFSEVFVNLIFRCKLAREDQYPEFLRVADELFREQGLWRWSQPRLYIARMPVPNAFAYGMGLPGCSAIAITPKLYRLFKKHPERLKAVLAHELAHIRCKDVGLLTVIGLMTSGVEQLRKRLLNKQTILAGGPIAFILAGVMWFVSKVVFAFLRFAVSQERELAADALGAYYHGTPDHLIEALKQLAETSDKSKDLMLSDLMVSHPGMGERIESLESLKQEEYVLTLKKLTIYTGLALMGTGLLVGLYNWLPILVAKF